MSLLMNILKIAGMGIVLIVVTIAAGYCFLRFDMMSYTATSSETMSPAGTSAGSTLVVYDPGLSGAAKNSAVEIADDLRSKGYRVDLAGVRSGTAGNVSGYKFIAVVGPAYWDKLGSAAQSYLENLHASPETEVGVFATGIIEPDSADPAYMREFVAHLPDDSPVKVKATTKLVTDFGGSCANQTAGSADGQCGDFVADLLR
ncbi:MAG TPA: hypothetical protein VK436_02260 [Methanocella sp.]|nr:hypothetical protein [Methanocella sp.]